MPIEISDTAGSSPQALARGDELVVRLPENPTTGFRWQLTSSGAGELALVEERFVPGSGSADPGAGGERLARYVGRTPGEVQIEAVLRREWDPPDASLQRRVFAVVVN